MNIEEIIKNMSIRPQMYVFPVTVEAINNYINGFLNGIKSQNPTHKFDFACINCVFSAFWGKWAFQWVVNNINSEYEFESFLWFVMFNSITKNEREAVKLFFSLCEKFFECFHEEKDPDYWENLSY